MTITEKREKLMKYYGTAIMGNDKDCVDFYYRCMLTGMSLIDTDEYATLNTLLGYDIGFDNANEINSELWKQGIETLELGIDEDSKKEIQKAAETRNIKLDFSKWRKEPYNCYSYFEEDMNLF